MDAIINLEQINVVDLPDKSPTTGMTLETKTRKVVIFYTVPEKPEYAGRVLVNHPATMEQINDAVAASLADSISRDEATASYKFGLTGKNSVSSTPVRNDM